MPPIHTPHTHIVSDHPGFDPLYAACERDGVPIWVHPNRPQVRPSFSQSISQSPLPAYMKDGPHQSWHIIIIAIGLCSLTRCHPTAKKTQFYPDYEAYRGPKGGGSLHQIWNTLGALRVYAFSDVFQLSRFD